MHESEVEERMKEVDDGADEMDRFVSIAFFLVVTTLLPSLIDPTISLKNSTNVLHSASMDVLPSPPKSEQVPDPLVRHTISLLKKLKESLAPPFSVPSSAKKPSWRW